MTEHPEEPQTRETPLEFSEGRKSLDSFDVPPPVPVETPMSAQMNLEPSTGESSGPAQPQVTPPTDFDG